MEINIDNIVKSSKITKAQAQVGFITYVIYTYIIIL